MAPTGIDYTKNDWHELNGYIKIALLILAEAVILTFCLLLIWGYIL